MSAAVSEDVTATVWVSLYEAVRRSAGALTRAKIQNRALRGEIRVEAVRGCPPRYLLSDVMRISEAIRAAEAAKA